MKRKLVLAILFSLSATTVQAATPVKMVGLKPTTLITLSQNPNDQVSAVLTSPTTVAIVGTMGTDGFITAYDRTASTISWNLTLGGPLDDIATAATRSSTGEFWIAGASAVPSDSVVAPIIPAGTLNPSGVLPDTSTALPVMKQLNIWKVSNKGVLLKSYSTVLSDVIFPKRILAKGSQLTITGDIAPYAHNQFSIMLNTDGTFTAAKISTVRTVQPELKEIKTSLSLWRSFTTSVAINGLPSWKPKANSHVLIRYDAKTKKVLAAYITSGEIVDFAWEKSIGIVALLSHSSGYSLALIK